MTKNDEEKTTFHTEEGVFCYTKMPFGLKNAGATYQRLVDSAFKEQIGVNLEAYVDDMVIKSKTEQDIIKDIEQTFSTLRRINMKLNPKKCPFAMEEGKFLVYVVTSEDIRANPEKAKAVMDMPSPKTLKQMQSLRFGYTSSGGFELFCLEGSDLSRSEAFELFRPEGLDFSLDRRCLFVSFGVKVRPEVVDLFRLELLNLSRPDLGFVRRWLVCFHRCGVILSLSGDSRVRPEVVALSSSGGSRARPEEIRLARSGFV
ncbi:reverse transcriptase domain-containing protein [Tanacetum coccineum]